MKNRKREVMAAAMFLFVLMLFALFGIQTATNLSEEMRTTHQDDIICIILTRMDFIRAFLQFSHLCQSHILGRAELRWNFSSIRISLIFTDFPTGSGYQPCAILEICEYQSHRQVYWKNSNVAWLSHI